MPPINNSLNMSNSIISRVSPVTKSLLRRTNTFQISRSVCGPGEDIIIHTGQVGDVLLF